MSIRMPRTFAGKLYTLVAFFSVSFILFIAYQMVALRSNLIEFKRTEIRSVVQAATNVADQLNKEVEKGTMTLEEAQEAARTALRGMKYSDGDYVFVYQLDGTNIVHPAKPANEGKNLMANTDANGKQHIKEMIDTAKNNGTGYVQYGYKDKDGNAFDKTSFVQLYRPWNWMLGSGVLLVDVNATFYNQFIKSASIAAAFLIAAAALGLGIARSVAGPLKKLSHQMNAISNQDLEVEIDGTERQDEVGEMSRAIAVFRNNALERARLEGQQKSEQAARLLRQEKIDGLISDFREEVENALGSVAENSSRMDDVAHALKEIATHTEQNAGNATAASERSTQNVQTVASAAEELAASIGEITRQVSQSSEVVAKATQSAQLSNSKVASLDQAAQKIGEVVSLIQAIAEQTNLLALNATIEAARAGEAGKGFAVVAAEVKELATQTSKATEEISAHIGAIQNSTDETVTAIEEITRTMEEVNGYTTAIAGAVEQQGLATREISENVQEAAEGTRRATDNMGQVTETATDTSRTADQVLGVSREVAGSTQMLSERISSFLKNVAAA